MVKVIFDMSMSLDGFITGVNRTREEPLGDEGEHLHDWAFNSEDEYNRNLISQSVSSTGAVICGRRTYDDSLPFWGAEGSTAAARRPTARSPVSYTAAKAGIQSLTQIVAAQVGSFGIRINCIAPETILTERNAGEIPADVQKMLVEQHPLRRLGTPADVADAALYLASDDASWITGVILDVAGGAVLTSEEACARGDASAGVPHLSFRVAK